MKQADKITVALVKPPIAGHLSRGTGTYFDNLKKCLGDVPELLVKETEISYLGSDFDLIHFPYFDPFFVTLPIPGQLGKIPHVVTVHDLIPLKYPDKYPKGLKGLFKWYLQQNSLQRASQIITDSYSSRNDIAKILHRKQDKISVVYLGVSNEFKKLNDQNSFNNLINKYNLPADFLLYVGDVNYNKNIPGLLNSFLQINNLFPKIHLVVIGKGFIDESIELKEIMNFIQNNNINKKVIRLAGLPIADLVVLYNLAKILLLPSIDEGFGLSILESFACHTPVIAGRVGSIEEIAKNAALLVNPFDHNEIAQSINELLNDKELQKKLINNGAERVKEFTWKKTALETVLIYKKILGLKDILIK